jgi:hypothetical protein
VRATFLAFFVSALLALPAVALASTPTDDVYSHADSRENVVTTTNDPGSGGGLAFTGLDVGFVAIAGAVILGTGIAIRRATRPN